MTRVAETGVKGSRQKTTFRERACPVMRPRLGVDVKVNSDATRYIFVYRIANEIYRVVSE